MAWERRIEGLFLCLSDGFPEEIAFKTRGADESFKDNGPYEFELAEKVRSEINPYSLFICNNKVNSLSYW